MKRVGYRLALVALLGAALTLPGCDVSGPDYSTYRLETINGSPLPFPYGIGTGVEIIAGEFQVHPGHEIEGWIQVRCRETQPPGTVCQTEGDGRIPQVGIFNGLENRFYPTGGGWFPMVLEADEALIQYGDSFELHHRYERVD
jgi:hypothetical protein